MLAGPIQQIAAAEQGGGKCLKAVQVNFMQFLPEVIMHIDDH